MMFFKRMHSMPKMILSTAAKLHMLVAAALLFLSNSTAFASPKCGQYLIGSLARSNDTERLITYLEELASRDAINAQKVSHLVTAIQSGKISNPILDREALINIIAFTHRNELNRYIEDGNIDHKKVFDWAQRYLANQNSVQLIRTDTRVETKQYFQALEFTPVKAGEFTMGKRPHVAKVVLENNFEVMTTPVTQKQWVDLMGENPSTFTEGSEALITTFGEKVVPMLPNHPVETMTWWSAIYFANELSKKHGLKPAYNFDHLTWEEGTKAANGTLNIKIGMVKINSVDGNIYNAEGYRLPTEAEQEYLLQKSVEHMDYFNSNISTHAWLKSNSENQTHRVEESIPLFVDGNPISDLFGNVAEWSNDWFKEDLTGGINPTGSATGGAKITRGSNWSSPVMYSHPTEREQQAPHVPASTIGFRLVRTIHSSKSK